MCTFNEKSAEEFVQENDGNRKVTAIFDGNCHSSLNGALTGISSIDVRVG